MKKYILFFASVLFMLNSANAQKNTDTTKNVLDKAKIQYKLSDAKSKYYTSNYRGALNIYREIIVAAPNTPKAHYGVAECQFALKNFELANTHMQLAIEGNVEVDKEVDYLNASIQHRLGNLQSALAGYEKFKATIVSSPKKMEEYDIDLMIAHCKYAIANATNISDVKIKNMGSAINTSFPEFAPCISLDGKSMVITSRRGDTKGGGVDVNFDHQYYSDVYISTWNDEEQAWNPTEPITGKINTEYHDGATSFMPSGELLLYRNIFGATRSGDIYFSKQSTSSGKWSTPREMLKKEGMHKKLNSTYFESSACMTEDEKALYFVSDRQGGQGQADIYVMKKKGREWTEPENLGAVINSASDEKCVAIHPSGNAIFFSSNGFAEGFGSYDLYYSVKDAKGNWSKPVNFGAPINTVKEEKTIAISADGNTAYVSAYYDIDNRGDADIYEIDISSLNIIK